MKFLTTLVTTALVALQVVVASPNPSVTEVVDYAALKARHFPEGVTVRRALDHHAREAELIIRTTSGEELIGRNMSPHEAAKLFKKSCCSIQCGPGPEDICCCNGCC